MGDEALPGVTLNAFEEKMMASTGFFPVEVFFVFSKNICGEKERK